ncbi:hypothetical protein [Candidatus Nephthysia bennettiae]|jgi:hypothetical protein|uniref:Uncharacterized protein n=1 Tax=Candidatus Nephthysia bennettiae TaxID=3127016 RepID=A0A934N8Y7_9BACT|nr:hypothetical protein [Candidatus Dormibacteraeota bacterium]MBJ7614673.1 hypothetical protein [Candidatus Dormibacteraeota bacterium]
MPLLKVSPSGQVYDVELPSLKVTRDQAGGYYVHGRGHFIFCDDLETAERKRRDLDTYGRRSFER